MLPTFKKTRENEKIIITSGVYKTIKEGISDNFRIVMEEPKKSALSTTSIKLIWQDWLNAPPIKAYKSFVDEHPSFKQFLIRLRSEIYTELVRTILGSFSNSAAAKNVRNRRNGFREVKGKMNASYEASPGLSSGIDVDVCVDQEDTKYALSHKKGSLDWTFMLSNSTSALLKKNNHYAATILPVFLMLRNRKSTILGGEGRQKAKINTDEEKFDPNSFLI